MRKSIFLATAFAMLAGASVRADDRPINLTISIWLPAAHPFISAAKAWADSVQKDSGGSIKSTIFPAEQLGKAFDHYDMARDGIADITLVNPGYQPGRFPIISIGQIPFAFGDGKKGSEAIDAWYRKYAATEMKETHFCFAFIHYPGSFHGRKKIVVPEDVRGTKVRPAQATIGQMVTMLGGTNVQASAPESRDMLERGVADAITFPWGSLVLFGIDKVTKYHMDAPLYTAVFTFSMNNATYDRLSPDQRKVIDNHCTTEWAEKVSGPWADFEAAGRDKVQAEAGQEIYKLTPEQLAQWQAVVDPLKDAWAASVRKVGVDPVAASHELEEQIKKYGAGL
jgi:TRAP-type C4-dicarboxylate transport system substrate-binding protein